MFDKNKMMKWIEKCLETDNFSLEYQGGSEGGYIGDVNFVKVTVNDPKKSEKELFLVVKVSKADPEMRFISSIVCRIEVIFYSEVLPIMEKFQQEKNVKPFTSIPKCYKTFIEDNTEVVVLENLKPKSYEMQNLIQPLNLNHIKLVLKNYAKFHAISLALSDQQPNDFKQIEDKFKYSVSSLVDTIMKPLYDNVNDKAVNYLIEAGRTDLAQKLGKLMEKGCYNVAKSSIDVLPQGRVVIHGDCHTQNFLFKYQHGDKENPLKMAFLDFQLSAVHSPMTDLGYFWYYAVSTEGFSHFKELMEFYYEELSSAASELGSDISKTFPISKMWNHWEKYSLIGFNHVVNFLDVFYAEGVVEVTDLVDETKDNTIKINSKNKSLYLERLVAITNHHFNYKI